MMDVGTLTCSNTDCAEQIQKNKKGTYPKFCSECQTPVVIPIRTSSIDIVTCTGCNESIERKSSGLFPKFCGECGALVVIPDDSSEAQSFKCAEIDCGELIKRNKKGLFPKFCPNCGANFIPPKEKPQQTELLQCPDSACGMSFKRNKFGRFPKECTSCEAALLDPGEKSKQYRCFGPVFLLNTAPGQLWLLKYFVHILFSHIFCKILILNFCTQSMCNCRYSVYKPVIFPTIIIYWFLLL